MRAKFTALEARIHGFIKSPGEDFDVLAREIFSYQYAKNAAYQAFADMTDRVPETIRSWRDIPAVPAEAFKMVTPLTCTPISDCGHLFLTSGTTGESKGRHYLRNTKLYRTSVLRGWSGLGFAQELSPVFLARHPAATPDSSLAMMFDILSAEDSAWLLGEEGQIDHETLARTCAQDTPILLFSTALALKHLFEGGWRSPLPAGSALFQTGGYKGLTVEYSPVSLYEEIEANLGVMPDRVINEYGMTELSSQAYARGLESPHVTPPWLKVRSLDPETDRECEPGEMGILCFLDLANLNSVVALRTEDLGTVLDEHHFVLAGRAPSASPRGCSRAADAHLQS